jgi:hypothetical protein
MATQERSHTAVGALLALLAVTATVGLSSTLSDRLGEQAKPDDAIPAPPGPPLAGGTKVSIDQAIDEFILPVFRPSSTLASDDGLSGIWLRKGADPEVRLEYDSGIIVTIRPAAGAPSTEKWAQALIGDGIDGQIEHLGGVDAFVVQPHPPSWGSVRFFVGEAVVAVIGHGTFTSDELAAVANSVLERADEVTAERNALA